MGFHATLANASNLKADSPVRAVFAGGPSVLMETERLNWLRNNSHRVIRKGWVCPRNLFFL